VTRYGAHNLSPFMIPYAARIRAAFHREKRSPLRGGRPHTGSRKFKIESDVRDLFAPVLSVVLAYNVSLKSTAYSNAGDRAKTIGTSIHLTR